MSSGQGAVETKRNNSHSASRAKAVCKTAKSIQVQPKGHILNSKSAVLGGNAAPSAGRNNAGLKSIIKKNIRKNQSKIEETLMRQQMEEYRQQQRRNNLSQRNKELRVINAAKVKEQPNLENQNTSIEKPSRGTAVSMEVPRDRKRSQSCVDYKSLRGKTMESYRKPTRSQERQEAD